MADFSIATDLYCLSCENLAPLTGNATVQVDFTADFDAGTGTPTAITAIISDGGTETGVITGNSVAFSHTFASVDTYTIKLQATFADTALPSVCGPYTVEIAA